MLRADIETFMKQNGISHIDLVYNKDDKLGIYCHLVNGTLKDYTNHVVDRKRNIWGYLKWADGKSERIAWDK